SAGDFSWVRTFGGFACSSMVGGIAVAADGSSWATGTFHGECTLGLGDAPLDSTNSDVFVVGLTATGALRATGAISGPQDETATAIVASGNALYLGGTGAGTIDFDPGAGMTQRTLATNPQSGFVVKLGLDGTFAWVKTLTGTSIVALAPASDG